MDTHTGLYKSLGFPSVTVHEANSHFDFVEPSRTILVIGPMGSGKTEYAARLWRDAAVARRKGLAIAWLTSGGGNQKELFEPESGIGYADRRNTFFVRYSLDKERFADYPEDALAYRGGYERCGKNIATISNSFDLEQTIHAHPEVGTWIIDEAAFYDERLAYLVKRESEQRGLVFVMPTLLLNFRGEMFNETARLLMETSTDIYPLSAYCEHPECLESAYNTYRYYLVDGVECPALFFDPLIIVGGDREKTDPREPNYCTRCDQHHYLPGKQYTYFTLKPLGERASIGDLSRLEAELRAIKYEPEKSELHKSFRQQYLEGPKPSREHLNALNVPCIAERAVVYLFAEQNLLSADQTRLLAERLDLDREYLSRRLSDNHRPIEL
ncbi:thymidine kinase [Treponema zuelzerae]|uniref:thymidine kinase n=1 Tax=Teretinema zuelzerae TaxID=156 RepID=A0AAE3EH69_9SPIR|nr:thymidine kinase [Teretinema zuelzerae]MBN2811812.1 thymidine kinase [Spirochaetales bacterium]MCD1654935.1 thymidine kinase [Teretinema zuelzerae]